MRILFDLRCLQSPPPRGGVGRYAEELTRAMLSRNGELGTKNGEHVEWLLFSNGTANPRRHLPVFDGPNVRWVVTRWPNQLINAFWKLGIGNWKFPAADIIWLPNLNFLPPIPRTTRLVVTVHDLSFAHFADCFTLKQRLWHRLVRPRKLLERADAIVAVSETTKRDVMATYGIPEQKIHVAYPGVEIPNTQYPIPKNGVLEHSPFIFALAELHPRKNFDGLIAAFEQLSTLHSPLSISLVIAGTSGSAHGALRRRRAHSPARDRIQLLGPITDDEKHAMLAQATCFAYPSIWEGFGIPPLEAMAAGVPVVASTGGALPEVLGDAALLVDPLDTRALAHALMRACTDAQLRQELITRGHAQAVRYTWAEAAERLAHILGGT